MLEDIFKLNRLYDFYGMLLTDNQRICFEYYYRDDYSLTEIAEKIGISKQGVSDNLKRATKELEKYEKNLKLVEKTDDFLEELSELKIQIENLEIEEDKESIFTRINGIMEELKE